MSTKIGPNCTVHRNTNTYGSPTWSECDGINDFDPSEAWDLADAFSRRSRAKKYAKTMVDIRAPGTFLRDPDDEDYVAFLDAARGDYTLDLLILDGPIDEEGSTGYRAHFLVTSNNGSQNVMDQLYMNFELVPGVDHPADEEPQVANVGGGGAITYSDFGEDAA